MKSFFGRIVAVVCACIVLFTLARSSSAQVGPSGSMPRHFPHAAPTPPPNQAGPGRVRISGVDGDRGPVVLTPKNGGYVGEFVVWNDGTGPLTVSRVAVRTDDDDPRLPSRFNARFADGGGGSGVIPAHSSKHVTITWVPDHEPKLHQAIGHVVLTSNDEGAPEVAMGFATTQPSLLASRFLSCLLALPLLGAAIAIAMGIVGYAGAAMLRGLFTGVTGVQCLLAIVLLRGFSGSVVRGDGNDGFQFIERSVLVGPLGVEYFVGVDGLSIALVLLSVVVGFAAAVMSSQWSREMLPGRLTLYYALFGLLLASVLGVFISLDLALFTVWWCVMLATLVGLLAIASPRRSPITLRFALHGAVSCALLAFAVAMLHASSSAAFIADGTRTPHSYAVPELMRVAFNAQHLTVLGCSWVKVVWAALFVAFAVLIPLAPFHLWLGPAVREIPAPVALVLASVVLKTGLYGLLRVSMTILPDGARWASTTLILFGVLNVLVGAASLVFRRGLLAGATSVSIAHVGLCLVGLGSLTREGIAGCLLLMISHGVLVAALILLSSFREAAGAPRASSAMLVLAFGAALLGLAGVPGLAGFWAETIPILGAFPVQRVLALIAAGGMVFVARSQIWTLQRLVAEGPPAVEPRALATSLPLLALALLLGLGPAPFFALVQGGVSDLNQLVNPPGPDEIALVDAG